MRKFNVNVNGSIYTVEIEETGEAAPVKAEAPKAAPTPAAAPATAAGGKNDLTAPMNGTILEVSVKVGDSVKAGDVVCVLEAMKMENEMLAPVDGVIKSVISKGVSVNTGDLLASIE